MTGEAIRRGRPEDLSEVYEIYYEAQVENEANPPPSGGIPPIFDHELESGDLHVMESKGQMVGFGSLITRSSVAFVAELCVRPTYRSRGYGGALLRHMLPRDGRVSCALSSGDPRALSLFVRAGMVPRWPCLGLVADAAWLGDLPGEDVAVVEGRINDSALVWWDTEVSCRQRAIDHTYWVRRAQAVPVWFRRHGRIVGYGYVQGRSEDWLAHPDAVTIGPVGTRTAFDAEACVGALVRWVASRAPLMRILVPGGHPALAPLVGGGFRIAYALTFMASGADVVAPPTYIPSGSALF